MMEVVGSLDVRNAFEWGSLNERRLSRELMSIRSFLEYLFSAFGEGSLSLPVLWLFSP